jgi:exodeoxyribonuclease VII small subunit
MPESTHKQNRDKHLTFEEAFGQLEESVRSLEAGGLTLDESTRLYEEGMRLAQMCNELLSATELRITRLQTSFGTQMKMVSSAESMVNTQDPGDSRNMSSLDDDQVAQGTEELN